MSPINFTSVYLINFLYNTKKILSDSKSNITIKHMYPKCLINKKLKRCVENKKDLFLTNFRKKHFFQ